jgi:glycosyltransferase involved in cell wall biosynthesis
MKKTILHFIYNLGRGGAERMTVKVIKELKEYNNIIVTLSPENHFEDELECDKYFCLNLKSILFFPVAVVQLRKIIMENNVELVHSHLFWPTFIARIGTPKKIPLVTTIHCFIANSLEYKSAYIRVLDKLSYRLRKSIIIAVAKGALEEYFSGLKLKPFKASSLYTFVDTREFNTDKAAISVNNNDNFKLIAVGALRLQKNYFFLLEAFKKLKHDNIELDIYGDGNLNKAMQAVISENNLKINLKGEVKNIQQVMRAYDMFVMSSTFEGFSLSVLEAMAMEMPMLLSDIKSFREQCEETAVYFDLNNVDDFVRKLKGLSENKNKLAEMAKQAKERVMKNFMLYTHMQGLRTIYCNAVEEKRA